MRIAQLAPLAESVPPRLYGGTERVIAWLVDQLVELGHDVTLFASGDSRTTGKLHTVWPRALRLGRKGVDSNAACALLIEAIAERAREFDVIHSHVDWLPLPVLTRAGVPFLTTMHGRLDLPGLSDVVGAFPQAPFVSISDNQRQPLPGAHWIATIPHGLPKDLFWPSYESGSYLAFLGRLTAEKGPEDAIRIARAVRMPLRIAAKIPRAETVYFKKKLEHEIDGENIMLIGEVDEVRKQPFLAGAAALLFPINWPEPFGLVMIEAMALWDARDRLSLRIGAGNSGGRSHRLYCGKRGAGDRSHQGSRAAGQKNGPRPLRGSFRGQSHGEGIRKPVSRAGRSQLTPLENLMLLLSALEPRRSVRRCGKRGWPAVFAGSAQARTPGAVVGGRGLCRLMRACHSAKQHPRLAGENPSIDLAQLPKLPDSEPNATPRVDRLPH
ncbi:hypothetical protein ACVW17_007132 [Bradyrhizobium sp. USDA 4473]